MCTCQNPRHASVQEPEELGTQAVFYPLIWLASFKTKMFLHHRNCFATQFHRCYFSGWEKRLPEVRLCAQVTILQPWYMYMYTCRYAPLILKWTTYLMQGNFSLLRNLLSPKHSIPGKTSHHTLVCCTSSYFEPPNWNLNAFECYLTELTTRKPNIIYSSNNHPACSQYQFYKWGSMDKSSSVCWNCNSEIWVQ